MSSRVFRADGICLLRARKYFHAIGTPASSAPRLHGAEHASDLAAAQVSRDPDAGFQTHGIDDRPALQSKLGGRIRSSSCAATVASFQLCNLSASETRATICLQTLTGEIMLRMTLGAILALAIISPGLTADPISRLSKKPTTTSIAGPRMVAISCPAITAEFFNLPLGEVCTGRPARTYWAALLTIDANPVDGMLIAALSGKPANIACTLSGMASDFSAMHWQQDLGGLYAGTSYTSGQSTAVFVNPVVTAIMVNGKWTWVSATCVLSSSGLVGAPFNIKKLALYLY
jgi:hypothetical protein